MKLKSIAVPVLFVMPFLAMAQSPITLSASNETALQQGVYLSRVVNTASLTPPLVGANKTWDYSKLKAGQINATSLVGAGTFSGSAVADTTATEAIAANFVLPITAAYDMDSMGFFAAGTIISKQTYSLGSGNTLTVPAQVYKYRRNYLSFPSTYNSVWKSLTSHTIKFTVYAPSDFLFNAPASKVSHTTTTDSVRGWGTLSIPSFNKGSIPYPVLLVKEQTKTVDSFFLYGSPAPAQLLDSFGVVQGSISYSYSEYFYRTGTLVPLLTIGYDTDYTYTNPSTANFTADNVQSGIEGENASAQNLALYPNPNSSGIVQCSFSKLSSAPWQLKVINSLGQIIGSQIVNGIGNLKEQIDLNTSCANGLYFIDIIDENGSLVDSEKLILTR